MLTETVDFKLKSGNIRRITYKIEQKGILEGLRTPIKSEVIKC